MEKPKGRIEGNDTNEIMPNADQGLTPNEGPANTSKVVLAVAAMLAATAVGTKPTIGLANVSSNKPALQAYLDEAIAKHRFGQNASKEGAHSKLVGRNFENYARNFENYGRNFENPLIKLRSGDQVSHSLERLPARLPNGSAVPESAKLLLEQLSIKA